jgi:hypothetical protein
VCAAGAEDVVQLDVRTYGVGQGEKAVQKRSDGDRN